MKKLIFKFSFCIILFIAFSQNRTTAKPILKDRDTAISVAIRNDPFFNRNTIQPIANKIEQTVVVHVTFNNNYCGGARPSEEMLNQYKSKFPLSLSCLILRSQSKEKTEIKVTTDKNGNFKVHLLPGHYSYFMTEKYNRNMGSPFDSQCIIWLQREFGEIEIKKGKFKGYVMNYSFGCNPCEPPRP